MNETGSLQRGLQIRRIYVVYALLLVLFSLITLRLFNLQIVQGEGFLARADDNRTSTISIPTIRGNIYDRTGYVLASNIPSYNVLITPASLPLDPGAVQGIYRELSRLIDVPVNNGVLDQDTVRLFKECETDFGITQIVFIAETNAPYSPVRVSCDVPPETALLLKEKAMDWPGVEIEIQPVREYPTGYKTAEFIGFLGPVPAIYEAEYRELGFIPDRDKVGYAGIELTQQDELGGRNGQRTVEVDAAGKILRDLVPPQDPILGNNVYLTIDMRLQDAAKGAMEREFYGWNAYFNEIRLNNGVVILMRPKTGEVLAMVSIPSYENNRMARFIPAYYLEQLVEDRTKPLLNHAVSAEHPPGSTYKMTTAIGALNEDVISIDKTINDPGKITIIQKFTPNDPGTPQDFVCWDEFGHGDVAWLEGIAQSCNVYFYKVGGGFGTEVPRGLGVWYLAEYARALGYGTRTGIELPGESTGLVPDPSWKRRNLSENWATGDTLIASVGQGFVLSTPLQVLTSINVLANDGKYMQPTIIQRITDPEGNVIQEFEPTLKWDITQDAVITEYDENSIPTGNKKTVDPSVVENAKRGMRMVVAEGTAEEAFAGMEIPSAGKTGTGEYCDDVAQAANRCQYGNWPTHSWYVGYAPYDDPEVSIVVFVYNGGEGASVAAPIARRVLDAYFALKSIDMTAGLGIE